MKVKIHREGRNILLVLFLILLIIDGLLYYFCPIRILNLIIFIASAVVFFLVLNFFRSPRRHFPGEQKNMIVAPADGVVVVTEEVVENEYFHDKRLQVSIFMNLMNVHANWTPVNGSIIHVSHQNGRYMAAWLPKSSTENERSTIVIKAENGQEILMRQIAGALAVVSLHTQNRGRPAKSMNTSDLSNSVLVSISTCRSMPKSWFISTIKPPVT